MSEEPISTKMINLCINTLNSDEKTPEEETLVYFTCNRLKNFKNWYEWKTGENKKIDQFMMQGMFGDPIHIIKIPKNATILHPYWQYTIP